MAEAKGQKLGELRQRMGVLLQQGALFTDLNVFENVAFPLREHTQVSECQVVERVLDKLDAVGLRTSAHLTISEISGGMARRVALARVAVLEPELVLYDRSEEHTSELQSLMRITYAVLCLKTKYVITYQSY